MSILLGDLQQTLLKWGTFWKNMIILEKHFTFYISHQLTSKQNGGGQQKSQCRHVVLRCIHRCQHQNQKVFPLEITKL